MPVKSVGGDADMAFGAKTNERPGTKATGQYVRMSASKVRAVLNNIRGESVESALDILSLTERGAAENVTKILGSAVANAEHNDQIPAEDLYVSACFADEGPTLKRFRPRARGRASAIHKQTCHITIIVSRFEPEEIERRRAAESAKGTARRSSPDQDRSARVAASRSAADDAPADTDTDTPDDTDTSSVDETTDDGMVIPPPAADDAVDSDAMETAGDDTADDASADIADAPHGDGSHAPLADGGQPEGFPIKGNEDSMKYHEPDGQWFENTEAEVWFATPDAAEAAGYTRAGGDAADDGDAADGEDD